MNLYYAIVRRGLAAFLAALTLSACASSSFVSSWKAPDATPLNVSGSKSCRRGDDAE